MKIRKLLLKAYGPFTDVSLELSTQPGVVNILYGENEAGKSTSLRAIERLYFGIPTRTSDDQLHHYDQMRVGACLELDDHTVQTFIRRKGIKNTLSDDVGATLPEALLDQFLCGVGKPGFEALFCLTHTRLNEGSEGILAEGGELGKLLFEARSDRSLRPIQDLLADRTHKLFRGTNRSAAVIDEALRTFDNHRKTTRKGDFAEYREMKTRLAELEEGAKNLRQQLDECRAHKRRLEKYRAAGPSVGKLSRTRQSLVELGPTKSLRPNFAEEFAGAKQSADKAATTHANAAAQVASLEARLAQIRPDKGLLAWKGEIERLNKQVEQISRHLADIPREQKKVTEAVAEARAALGRIRPGKEPNEAELQISEAQRRRISGLRQEKAKLDENHKAAKHDHQRIGVKLLEARAKRDRTSTVRVEDALHRAVSHAQRFAEAEQRQETDLKELRDLGLACEQLAAQLGAAGRPVKEFARIEVPTQSLIRQFSEEWRRLEEKIRSLQVDAEEAEAAASSARADKQRLLQERTVPTEKELSEARARREAHWRQLKVRVAGDPPLPVAASEIATFETTVAEADALSDGLRFEADRVAALAAIEGRIQAACLHSKAVAASLLQVQAELVSLEEKWRARWKGAGIIPDPPAHMLDWLARFDQLSKDNLRWEVKQIEATERAAQIESARRDLASALQISEPNTSLAELLPAADSLIRSAEQSKGLIAQLDEQIRADEAAQIGAVETIGRIEARLNDWHEEWKSATECLRLPNGVTPEEADEAVAAISAASQALTTAGIAQKRVEGMERDHFIFAQAGEKLVEAVAPELKPLPPLAAIQTVYLRLGEATTGEAQRAQLEVQLADQRETLLASEAQEKLAADKLRSLCEHGECGSVQELEVLVDRYTQVAALLRSEQELIEQLESIAAGTPLDAFCREVEVTDQEAVLIAIDNLQTEEGALEAELGHTNQAIGIERRNQETMDRETTQIESLMAAESALAKVRSAVRPYLVSSLAESLIRAQIEEFRKANQGPILRKASEIFSVLTDGSFSELSADRDDSDHPVLIAARTSRRTGAEERLKVDALSSATRVALYLSLRLACIYRHVEQREGLPFVADDILLDFDDRRAHRVMEELGRLAEKTQVILFTHHRHLVDIGNDVLGNHCHVQSLTDRG